LPSERIDYYPSLWDIQYMLVRENQIPPDEDWNHIECYPKSFYKNLKEMYLLVYTRSYGNIEVHEVN